MAAARPSCTILALAALAAATARADVVVLEPVQVGGFYAGGATPDNTPGFQNYFVGYGTSPGGSRTPERRSFFWFDLSAVSGTVHSAALELELIFGGVVFGKGPGVPGVDPILSDPFEEFQLGVTPLAPAIVTSPMLTPMMIEGVFASLASTPIAMPLTFAGGTGPPPTVIPLGPAGLGAVAAAAGGDIVLTGWMPTWSEDLRITPGSMPPAFVEGSELIFGFTDLHAGYPKPKLTVTFTPVPEAGAAALLAAACAALAARRVGGRLVTTRRGNRAACD